MQSIQNPSEMSKQTALQFNDIAGLMNLETLDRPYDKMYNLLTTFEYGSDEYNHVQKLLAKYWEVVNARHEFIQMAFAAHDDLLSK